MEHERTLGDGPAIRVATPQELAHVLGEQLPEQPGDIGAALDLLERDVLANMQHGDHPRYFARVPGPSNAVGALADALGAGHNVIAASWAGSSGPAALELTVLEWLRQLLGMPDGTGGLLVSGGSVSSLTALAAARFAKVGDGHDAAATVYLSDQTHASLVRALRILGFARDRIRILPSDPGFRLVAGEVAAAVAADRRAGLRPIAMIATAGTTNTGAVDPLGALADLCADEDLWLHVDGAYGAPAALTARGREQLSGMDRADSLSVDPHKWLFQPYEVGALLVRDTAALEAAFAMSPEYLRDVAGGVNFRDRGPQLTRGSRALKLWLSLKVFGAAAFRAAVERGVRLAEVAEEEVRTRTGWEVVTPAQLGIVTFARLNGATDHGALAAALAADGFALAGTTVLRGREVLRLCTINPRTSEEDVRETVRRLTPLRPVQIGLGGTRG